MSSNLPDGDPTDWISQAEAARIHGVSRQAISQMIRAGRLRPFEVGGRSVVSRTEVEKLRDSDAGPSQDRPDEAARFIASFDKLRPEVKTDVLERLRARYPVHPFETMIGASAQVIMEALARSGPLTIRGLRGVLAESAFEVYVIGPLVGWASLPTPKDPPYDFLLDDGNGPIKVQVKLQRSRAGRPMLASEGSRRLSSAMSVVETQRTRSGKTKGGEDTRPYRFGEFDILAVAMQASTQDWRHFLYTVGDWLLPRPDDERLLLKFQPVPISPNDDWTDDFLACIARFRSGSRKVIGGLAGEST